MLGVFHAPGLAVGDDDARVRRRRATPHTAGLVGPEQYREVVTPDHAEGVQYHVLPTDDPVRTLNILREAAGLPPFSDEHDDQGGSSVSP